MAAFRLFVAIELPDAWRGALQARAATIERLAPGYTRWVAPELLHLTVLFLGDQPAECRPAIEAALAAAAVAAAPFTLSMGSPGSFGRPSPRVLWVAAHAPTGVLEGLHAALGAALRARAIAFDAKPLVPHLTLGRARRDADPALGRQLAERLAALPVPAPPPAFRVDAVTLMHSELSGAGPRYTPWGRWPLGSG